jgi:hypothetical protein
MVFGDGSQIQIAGFFYLIPAVQYGAIVVLHLFRLLCIEMEVVRSTL